MIGRPRIVATAVLAFGVALTAVAYRPALDAGFVFDDISSVVEAPALHWSAVSLENVQAVIDRARLVRRPVANLSFALNHAVGGLDPRGYHLVNLLVHLAVGAVLFWVALLFLGGLPGRDRGSDWNPVWAAVPTVLFLLHPLNTQAVTYVVQRMSSLAALFCLSSLGAYMAARRSASRAGAAAWGATAAGSWLLALGTKENAILLPLVVATWEWCFHRETWRAGFARWRADRGRDLLGAAVALLLLIVSGLVLARYARGASLHLFDAIPGRDFTGLERMLTQARVQLLYLGLLLWPSPSRLNLDHDVAVSRGLLDPPVTLLAVAIWLAAIAGAVVLARRRPAMGFPLLAYLELHLLEAGPFGLDLMFEHRMYLPMAMLVLLGAAALATTRARGRAFAVAAALVAALPLAGATTARNRTWADQLELHRDVARKSPRKARAQHNLGVALLMVGQPSEAVAPLELAVRLDPNAALPWSQLGHAYLETGRPEQAEAAFRRAFALDPRDDRSGYNVGLALERRGRTAEAAAYLIELGTSFGIGGRTFEAIRALRRAVELDPGSSTAQNQLGSAYYVAGRLEQAVAAYREAARLDPGNVEALYNLGLALERSGDVSGAEAAYREFLRRAPPRLETQIEQVRRKLTSVAARRDAM